MEFNNYALFEIRVITTLTLQCIKEHRRNKEMECNNLCNWCSLLPLFYPHGNT